jgi:hypothetical protein
MRQTGGDLSNNGLGLHLEPSVVDFHLCGLFDINVKVSMIILPQVFHESICTEYIYKGKG